MQVIEAQCASILEPHDHLHISHERMVGCDQQQPGRPAVSPWPYRSVGETDQMKGGCR
jgi:hypothetical protein